MRTLKLGVVADAGAVAPTELVEVWVSTGTGTLPLVPQAVNDTTTAQLAAIMRTTAATSAPSA